MAFKLIEAAQARWRAVNAPHLVALVRAGAKFDNGKSSNAPKPQPPKTMFGTDGRAFHRPLAISVAGLMLPASGWPSSRWSSPSRTARQVKHWPISRSRSP